MTSPETAALRQRVRRVISHRAGSSTGRGAVAAAAGRAHDELTAVLAPLISSSGVEALSARAFDLARREYPAEDRRDGSPRSGSPFGEVHQWLERQDPSAAAEAAAAMFAAFAELLATLIGEPLTTQYLQKAWPDAFSGAQPKGRKA